MAITIPTMVLLERMITITTTVIATKTRLIMISLIVNTLCE